MKIKHFAGYGSVTMTIVSKSKNKLIVSVKGMHEYGMDRDDNYNIQQWLLPHIKGYQNRRIESMDLDDHYLKEPYITSRTTFSSTEECIYTIYLEEEN